MEPPLSTVLRPVEVFWGNSSPAFGVRPAKDGPRVLPRRVRYVVKMGVGVDFVEKETSSNVIAFLRATKKNRGQGGLYLSVADNRCRTGGVHKEV